MKKVKKIVLTLGVIAAFFLAYKCFIAGHTIPILKENSISEYQMVTLGGVQQSILIRGSNRTNPILLYIHGGPGNPETSFIVPYQKEWEDYYTVVNWDQRGAGRSYHKEINQDMLTTDQICADAIELTQYLKERFQVDKIYIVGHSYGTYVGMKCIQQNPQDYYAYVGIGQIGNQQDNEKYLLAYAVQMAKEHNNQKALSELSTLGKLPYTKQDFGNKISLSRKWTTYYGGAIYGDSNTNRFNTEAIFRPEYSLFDLIHYLQGANLYYTNTEKDDARWELFNANLPEEIPAVDVPIYFIQGKNDFIVSFQACQEYYDKLQAPYKKLFPIQNCAHNPIVEHTDEVSRILINEVLANCSSN